MHMNINWAQSATTLLKTPFGADFMMMFAHTSYFLSAKPRMHRL